MKTQTTTKPRRLRALPGAFFLALAISQSGYATLFFTDQFNYPDNSNLGAITGPWNTTTAGGGDNATQIKVSTASAQTSPSGYSGSAFNGVAVITTTSQKKTIAQFNGATGVPVGDGNVVYASFLLNVQTKPASGTILAAFLHDISANSGQAIQVHVSSTGQIGVQKRSGTMSLSVGTPFASAGTHLVVMRYKFQAGADEVAVWVDPSSGNYGVDPAPATTVATTSGSDFGNPIKVVGINSAAVAGPVFWVDEVRVGTTWAETVPSGCTAPTPYTVGGSGAFCPGNSVNVTLSGSQSGVTYQLLKDGVPSGGTTSGTGSALSWTVTEAGVFTVKTTSAGGYCEVVMTGSAVVTANTAPAITGQPGNQTVA